MLLLISKNLSKNYVKTLGCPTKFCIFRNLSSNPADTLQKPSKRRVVVTGLGVISPVGCNTQTAWSNILKGFCGIQPLTGASYDSLPCKIAAQINREDLKLDERFSKSELRAIAPATAYALLAGKIK